MPVTEYAAEADVRCAIEALTDIDYIRLRRMAALHVCGSAYCSAHDLVSHALATAFVAARGGEGRRWAKGVEFIAYLFMTVRGLASDSRKATRRRREVANLSGLDFADSLQFAAPPLEEVIVEEEEEVERTRRVQQGLKQMGERFGDDAAVCWVIRGLLAGMPARVILEESGMSRTQYDSAHRRWRRGLTELFPDRQRRI
jgi:DNA-directed RNA polymerase specialized sigma24 family protein